MIIYRLSHRKFKHDLSGKGAEIAGGRWNSKGVPMLYTADSRALCTAEIAVHTPLGIVPKDYFLITIEIPAHTKVLEVKELPENWKAFPHLHQTQEIGDAFIRDGKYLVMKAPSAVVQGDFNYLINPNHRMAHQVKIIQTEPYSFDERLFRKP
jgi:RES domain-containing protein